MLRRNVLFPLMPRRAPTVLSEKARRGDAGMHRVFRGARKPLRKTPLKTDGAQDIRGIGVSNDSCHPGTHTACAGCVPIRSRRIGLLDTFLWTSKEKYLGCRSDNRLHINRRDSDTKHNWLMSMRNIR